MKFALTILERLFEFLCWEIVTDPEYWVQVSFTCLILILLRRLEGPLSGKLVTLAEPADVEA